jgi:regulator of replication initiation timing
LDLFNKKKLLRLQNEVTASKTTILEMRKQITLLKSKNSKLKEENSNLKFTLKHQRTY